MSYVQHTNTCSETVPEQWLLRRYRKQNAPQNPNSKIKTLCFISGRTKSTYRFANLSRHQIKIMLTKGALAGFKPSS